MCAQGRFFMNTILRDELLTMQAEDLRVREDLAKEGVLGDGYEPRMEDVHRRNAARLEQIIEQHGWPGRSLVGDDAAEAAWRTLQQAISRPDLIRRYLPLLQQAAAAGEVPNWQPAYVLDRICFFEGQPQVFGTQYDLDDEGFTTLWPVEDPGFVNERRKSVGLPPLAEQGARSQLQKRLSPEQLKARREATQAWARSVGWRA
jgi:Family of unknown function (DUF6624)